MLSAGRIGLRAGPAPLTLVSLGAQLSLLPPRWSIRMPLDEREELTRQVKGQLQWCNGGSRLFSFLHHGSLASAAILSAAAAVAAKLSSVPESQRGDWTTVLAGGAALMATLAAGGGFERKWRTNRVNRGRCQSLLILLSVPDTDLIPIRAELLRIMSDQDQGVVGQQAIQPPPATQPRRATQSVPDPQSELGGG